MISELSARLMVQLLEKAHKAKHASEPEPALEEDEVIQDYVTYHINKQFG